MEHYYTSDSQTEFKKKQITHEIAGQKFNLVTGNAVFSKDAVDFGSHFLIDVIINSGLLQGTLLDVGCGYGVIGIALATFNPALNVTMVDINQRAVVLAQQNIVKQGLTKRVKVEISNICEKIASDYDYIVTNPPIRAGKQIVQEIYNQSYQHLKIGGQFFVVIQKKQGAASSKTYLNNLFGNCEVIKKKAGYCVLNSIRKK